MQALSTPNQDLLIDALARTSPGARTVTPEGSFLAWIDFTAWDLPGSASDFFMARAGAALNLGIYFGPELGRWTRLNFGCPPELLATALDQMASAIDKFRQERAGDHER